MSSNAKSYDEVPSSKLCSLSVDIRFRVNVGFPSPRSRRRSAPPPYSESKFHDEKTDGDAARVAVVRSGPVHIGRKLQIGRRVNWLVLTETHLASHKSANTNPEEVIPLSEIVKLDRAESESCALILETAQGKHYVLNFENDNVLYDWQDAIRSHLTSVSAPWGFKHNVHCFVDPRSGNYVGLPKEWRKLRRHSQELSNPKQFVRPLRVGVFIDVDDDDDLPSQILLRIKFTDVVVPNPGLNGRASTTLSVTPDTRLADVLNKVCRKLTIVPQEGTLGFSQDRRGVLSLDDTVADLQGDHDLQLVNLSHDQGV